MTKTGAAGALVSVEIDRSSDVPIHIQIAGSIRTAIQSRRLQPGIRLASTRALARDWNVSRNTVLHVFENLMSEGLVQSRVGSGTYVASVPTERRPSTKKHQNGDRGETETKYPFKGLSRRGRSLVAQSQLGLSEKPVAFMPDVPDIRAFPMRSWLRLMNEVSGRLKGDILISITNTGYDPLREAIANHLNLTRGLSCTKDDIIITTGTQQSVDLVTRLLLERGDPVWVEEPGYMGTRATLLANGCAPYPIPADTDGMNVEDGIANAPVPRMVVISPSRHYPLGGRLSAERRQALLELSKQSGTWILEDDYDSDFDYGSGSPSALQADDTEGRVILIGTFSKTLLPSFRLGYIVSPPDLAHDFAHARSVMDRHAPIFEQLVLSEFMHRGLYATHLRTMRSLYCERQAALVDRLDKELGYIPNPSELASGMHIVLPLSDDVDDRETVRRLQADGTVARPLSIYYANKKRRSGIILGFAGYTPEEINLSRLDVLR
ncbi:MAG: PLP-dependent aminotransferase family protein [Pseudomonadota bacterium]